MLQTTSRKRRYLVPKTLQTSAVDCGAATLKGLFEGYGIRVHYPKLRERCLTEATGTTTDVLEQVASQFGLDSEQTMMPVHHLFTSRDSIVPAIVVLRRPNGYTHFVLVWRRHGPFLQVMDPAVGRRWVTRKQFLDELYVHSVDVPAREWRRWALSDQFRVPLVERLASLGLGSSARDLFQTAANAGGWRALATLDAAARFVERVVQHGGVKRGVQAQKVLKSLLDSLGTTNTIDHSHIPSNYWSVLPSGTSQGEAQQLRCFGAVVIQVRGRAAADAAQLAALRTQTAASSPSTSHSTKGLLAHLLRGETLLSVLVLLVALVLTSSAIVLEALLLRAAVYIGRDLSLAEQRLQAFGFILLFAAAIAFLESWVVGGFLRLGRRLEVVLRAAFFEKIPWLHDRQYHSLPHSDLAERAHAIQHIRYMPRLASQFVRTTIALTATAAGIVWVAPDSSAIVVVTVVVAMLLPALFLPLLAGLGLRAGVHAGALSRFYLDSLLGIAPVRAHRAERALVNEFEGLLSEWGRANQRLHRCALVLEVVQAVVGFGFSAWLILVLTEQTQLAGAILLLAYWTMALPGLGGELVALAQQYPHQRNAALRLAEPLESADDQLHGPDWAEQEATSTEPVLVDLAQASGVAIHWKDVTVYGFGQTILKSVTAQVEAGAHVAIVGPSGAGKSTLVGLLLGWYRAAEGEVLVANTRLRGPFMERLRNATAWVDPSVQIWNQSLLRNLLYGNSASATDSIGDILEQASLCDVLHQLPRGLQTCLGEGGGTISGGEGQRVRFARALGRQAPALVILDEAFRGLDRDVRKELVRRARQRWPKATLLCVTHDVSETLDFDQVVVVEDGQVVESGCPEALVKCGSSRYRTMVEADEEIRAKVWFSPMWRRLRLEAGRLSEGR
jgi:ABC-type bacteriocin/lantibiotic exporter with double-glycine peptidase domain